MKCEFQYEIYGGQYVTNVADFVHNVAIIICRSCYLCIYLVIHSILTDNIPNAPGAAFFQFCQHIGLKCY